MLRERLIQATGGRYTIEDELGRGGMAVVYAATDMRLKRPVAIKALPPELAFRSDVKSRFLREAQLAAALSHPNIVPIYAVDETDGLVYMVMGRVTGESLAKRLHREPRLPFGEARRILRETADALSHAHAHGVIHRDIKPDNILLDGKTGRVLVTDFGIARAMEGDARITVTGVAVGTPTYMSPEQARGDHDVDGRADIYALGIVGFQVVVGEPPFAAPNTPALLLKHVSEPPPPIATKRSDVPVALAYAIERALAKDRHQRWATAAAFRDALGDDAVAPSAFAPAREPQGLHVAIGKHRIEIPLPSPPQLPPYPAWGGGDRERWREAQRQWRERVRAQQHAWKEEVRARQAARVEERRSARHAARHDHKSLPLTERLKHFQRHVISNVFVMGLLFVINAMTGGFPWFIFPWIGMAIGIAIHGLTLWQDGVSIRDMIRRPATVAALSAPAASADPAADADARARALVGSDVLAGPHGDHVRRACEDERAVADIVRGLPAADRAQLPDVEPTLKSLLERVGTLAQALHRLDADVRPEQLRAIESRLADARRLPEGTERDRRVSLLERQQSSIGELSSRREALAEQLESASLVLQTMRLDLLRLRSAGIGNAAADITSVTQEARALSTDISRVLDAAAEVRKL